MKQSVRIVAALAAASLSIGLVAGCGGSDSSASTTAADTSAAVDTTAVGTDVGPAINAACEQFKTDVAAAVDAGDYDAFASAFDTYKESVTDAASSAPDDTNAVAYLGALEASGALVDQVKTEIDGGATLADAIGSVDSSESDATLKAAAEAGGYDSCIDLHTTTA